MKKTVAIVLALTSISAFASKARLEALGESKDGSYYIQDNRDMFLNPAHVNYHKDFLTFEWGDQQGVAATDNVSTPRAEGGFYRSMGSLNYGLYLGSQDSRVQTRRSFNVGAAHAFQNMNNPVDLFVGGEASSMKWGANLTYSTSETNNLGSFKQEQDYLGAKVGVEMNNLEVFAQADIVNDAKGANTVNDELEGNFGGQLGATYMLNDLKLFGSWNRYSYDFKDQSGTAVTKYENKDSAWKLGVGRQATLNDKTKLFTKVEYNNTRVSSEKPKNPAADKAFYTQSNWNMPIAIGLEHDALSWLTLRGSVVQTLWNNNKGDETLTKRTNDTDVNMGATLALGSVKLDGLVGTTNGSAAARTAGTENGVLALDNLMTRVALRYNF